MKKSLNKQPDTTYPIVLRHLKKTVVLLLFTVGILNNGWAQCTPAPNAPTIALSNYTPCAGSSITVQVSSIYLPNANWMASLIYPGGSQLIPGNGNYTIPANASGNIYVYIQNNANGCPNTYTSGTQSIGVLTGNKPTAQSDTVIRFCTGDNKFLFVTAPNSASTFQWKKNGTVVGTNNDTLFLNTMTATDSGSYKCYISSSTCGTDSSKTIKLKFGIIESQSANLSLCTGSQGLLWVKAPTANNFVWKFNGNTIPNSNNDTLAINNYTTAQAGTYTCEASLNGGCLNTASFTISTNAIFTTFDFNGTIAYYPMNGNVNNAVSTNWNGTASAGATLTTDRNGVANNAYSFDGTVNAKIDMGDITPINGAAQLTIAGWFNTANITTNNELFGKTNGSSQGIYARNFTGTNYAYLNPSTYTTASPFTTLGIINNQWFHYAVTYNSGSYSCYINGVLQQTISSGSSLTNTAGFPFQLGENGPSITGSINWNGKMDDVSIFTRQLVTSEVLALKDAPHFSQHPQSSTVCAGNTLVLSVISQDTSVSYQWRKGGSNIAGATSSTFTKSNAQASDAGAYTCVITRGCSGAISLAATVTISPNSVSITSQPQAQSKCVGQPVTFTIAATGGTGYQWKKNGSALSGQTSATLNISAVALTDTGTYTCDVIGGTCGTISSNAAYLTVNAVPTASISPSTVSICAGVSQTLTASGNGTYAWSNSGGSIAAATFTPSSTTTYTVTVTAGICSAIASSTVTVNAIPTASISPATVTICAGAAANLTASGGGTYAWSNSGGTAAAASFSPTTTSTYTVTVTTNNCSATASRLVTVNALPTASITPSTAVSVCAGLPTTLTAAGGISYAWSNSGGSAAAATFSPTTTTTYTVTVTTNNCSATASKLVVVNTPPTVTLTPSSSVVCAGGSVTLTADGGVNYQWNQGLGFGSSKSLTLLTNTATYAVTAYDANNCSASASTTITVNTTTAAINGPTTICSGLSATLTASGGGTYAWSNSLGNAAAVTVSPTTATTYTVTVTNNNCTATASQTVSVQSAPTAVINGASSVCAGSSITLTANGGNTYTWSNSGGNAAAATFSPTTTTTYTVTASLGAGCTATATKTITIKQPTSGSYNQTICFGQSVLFNGISRTQSGAYLDTLVNLAGCDSFLTLNLTVRPQITGSIAQTVCFGGSTTFNGATLTQSGVFKDTLTSVTGCDSILTLTFTVRPRIVTSITQPICNGSAITFNGQTITTAGTYLDTLTSVNGCDSFITLNVTIAQATAASISKSACGSYSFGGNTLTASGTYLDTIPNTAGCDSVITLNLTINQATASTKNDTICFGTTYAFGSQTLSTTGTYTRTIPNAVGCDSVITLNLFVRPAINISITQNGLDLTATAGFTDYFWKLNGANITAANLNTYTTTSNGAYSVQVVDANNCSAISNTVNVNSVGIEDLLNFNLSIYPNPATDIITIETDEQVIGVELFSAIGQKINVTANANQQINISDLAAGAYSLIIHTTNGSIQKRFVKE